MKWVEVTVDATDASADAVTNILIEEGCGGTAVSCSSACVQEAAARVVGYLPVDDRLESRLCGVRERVRRLPELGLELRSGEIGVKWVEDSKWAEAWKQHFRPLRVGRVVVKPSWEEYAAQPGDVIVGIDPGMAFGTGNHETTQLCLLALQDCINGGETVLDVGTGSGILAIAAVRLGAEKAVGLEVDSVAVEVAQANVEREGLSDTIEIRRADSPEAFEGTADIVVANILANVVMGMADDLRGKVRSGGRLIVSGIVRERAADVRQRLQQAGLRLLDEPAKGEWVAQVCEVRSAECPLTPTLPSTALRMYSRRGERE